MLAAAMAFSLLVGLFLYTADIAVVFVQVTLHSSIDSRVLAVVL